MSSRSSLPGSEVIIDGKTVAQLTSIALLTGPGRPAGPRLHPPRPPTTRHTSDWPLMVAWPKSWNSPCDARQEEIHRANLFNHD